MMTSHITADKTRVKLTADGSVALSQRTSWSKSTKGRLSTLAVDNKPVSLVLRFYNGYFLLFLVSYPRSSVNDSQPRPATWSH